MNVPPNLRGFPLIDLRALPAKRQGPTAGEIIRVRAGRPGLVVVYLTGRAWLCPGSRLKFPRGTRPPAPGAVYVTMVPGRRL